MLEQTALFTLSYGLYIVGAAKQSGFAGRVLDAFAQISGGEQPRVVASFMKEGDTIAAVRKSAAFSVSVLPQDAHPFLIANFGFQSGAKTDKWANIPHEIFEELPVVTDALAVLICAVEEMKEYDTHTVCLCRVVCAKNGRKAPPMLYAQYHSELKQQAQNAFQAFQSGQAAPGTNLILDAPGTDMPEEEALTPSEGKWVCTLCGYVYEGEIPFEQLPENWLCPLCGAPKSFFELE